MTYTSEVLADSPSGYWRLSEPSGTSAADSSGGSNTGTYVNAPTLGVTGALGTDTTNTAVMFNGTDEKVTVPDHASLDVGDVFTVECWMKTTTTGTGRVAIERGENSFQVGVNRESAGTGKVSLAKRGVVGLIASSSLTVNDGAWHHVVVTKSAATSKVYVDGVDVTVAGTDKTMTNTVNALGIGSTWDTVVFFPGSLDEVAVYPTALSAARVLAHYQAGSATRGAVELSVSVGVDASGSPEVFGAATLTVPVSLSVPGGVVPVTLDPVNPGTLTLDGLGSPPPISGDQPGNLLPYQVGVEFLGPMTVEPPVEPGTYVPVLTPHPPVTLTGSPH